MRPMTTTTLIILNGFAAVGLLVALALVMLTGHRTAGSDGAGAGHWTQPLEPELVRAERDKSDLTRAA
jgi:hypothetical protein